MSEIIKFDRHLTAAGGLKRADFPAELLRSGDPRQWGHYYLERRDIGLIGMWTATPYRRERIPYPRFEMMYALEGKTRFPGADGSGPEMATGETVLVCKGAEAEWWNEVPTRSSRSISSRN